MISHLFYYQLVLLGLLWLFVMLHSAWPSRGAPVQGTSAQPIKPRRQRSKELKPVWSKNSNACFPQRLWTCHHLLNVLISPLL
jgi:hypothetical protein